MLFLMINPQIVEMLVFLSVLLIFLIGYGVASQALLYPNQTFSAKAIEKLFFMPYFQVYGELFLEDIATGKIKLLFAVLWVKGWCTKLKNPDISLFITTREEPGVLKLPVRLCLTETISLFPFFLPTLLPLYTCTPFEIGIRIRIFTMHHFPEGIVPWNLAHNWRL